MGACACGTAKWQLLEAHRSTARWPGMVQIICANTKVEEIRLWEMVGQDEEGETLEQ